MEIKRTANAGVLLKLDGVNILIDGVCGPFKPYLETPEDIKIALTENFPDAYLVTHKHPDHYDLGYLTEYANKTFRSHLGAEGILSQRIKNVSITAVPTRHIGKNDGLHYSFVIEGSKTVWFMGDASPNEIVKLESFTKPDILIIPYAYVITPAALKITRQIGAKLNVLLHLPDREMDEYNLWGAVEGADLNKTLFKIPEISENLIIS